MRADYGILVVRSMEPSSSFGGSQLEEGGILLDFASAKPMIRSI
jgi:hypothetical protein